MLRSGRLYCAFHLSALAGVPVTMPARRQYFVCCNAGAIWWVLRLPRPTRATPSFLSGPAARTLGSRAPTSGILAAAMAVVLMKSRRVWNLAFMVPSLLAVMLPTQSRNRRKQTGRRARKSARRSGCPLVRLLAMSRTQSEKLFAEALKYIPGGVNSPVRAFRAVGGQPFFVNRAKGAHIWDVDGNELIDYV